MRTWLPIVAIALLAPLAARAQDASPHAIEVPSWFALSFLDFREDVAEAKRDGKRLLVYFGQDGCPYCTKLMQVNFAQRSIVEKTRRHFVPVALNLWGDREVTWTDGRQMSEKALGALLAVQFTPTLLFFDEEAKVVLRLNGYSPPGRFEAALDYVAAKREKAQTFAAYLDLAAQEPANPRLADEPFFMAAPFDLRRGPGARPLLVVFETVDCPTCDELHREVFTRREVLAQIGRFDVARFALGARTPLTTPDGRATTAQAWARELGVSYAPTLVLFAGTAEAMRLEAYFRPFHVAGSLDYVASGAWRSEPSFQRFLQARAEAMRTRGERVELME